jgi:hypothetical protein
VAFDNESGKVAGVININKKPTNDYYTVNQIAVNPGFKRQGVASALLQYMNEHHSPVYHAEPMFRTIEGDEWARALPQFIRLTHPS